MIVLLMMVLLSLSVAYFTFYSDDTTQIPEYSTSSKTGDKVYLEGTVTSEHLTKTGGHLLLEVEHDSVRTKVFVPKNSGAQEIASILSENSKVYVTGEVQEYQGEPEIVVQGIKDIKLL